MMIGDNTDDNISYRNSNYGEFTAHYWVLNNYLRSCEEEYIGFCHYRRFFNWLVDENIKFYKFKSISQSNFIDIFNKFDQKKIYTKIKDYDIILPHKITMSRSIIDQYASAHPYEDMINAINITKRLYPDYIPYISKTLNGKDVYFCLNFTMKKNMIIDFIYWSQSILDELYKNSDFSKYNTYRTIRTPAYIMERLFNVWIAYQIGENNIKILELDSYQLA